MKIIPSSEEIRDLMKNNTDELTAIMALCNHNCWKRLANSVDDCKLDKCPLYEYRMGLKEAI